MAVAATDTRTRLARWAQARPGTTLPELVKIPDHRQIFMFSAATWNRHAVHYSTTSAQSEGFRDVVVQRALIGNYLAQLITEWIGEEGELEQLQWKVVHSAYPGDTLTCSGEVVENLALESGRRIRCEVRMMNQEGQIIARGEARVGIL
jgi:hydroxyacyl-ACP dehydratase HTD2-like protein with hotdog domain